MKITKTTILLTITNIATFAALLIVAIHYNVPQKLMKKLGVPVKVTYYEYADNYRYGLARSLYKIYKPQQANIVMLGDSITANVDWNELLSRSDIANRGIGSDITEGMFNRLEDIYSLNPNVCFIMAGINDVAMGIDVNVIYSNYTRILDSLVINNITPVIQSTLYMSRARPGWESINSKVEELNALLRAYAEKNEIKYLNVNSMLANNGALKEEYTFDGIHLLGSGYEQWRGMLQPVVNKVSRNNK